MTMNVVREDIDALNALLKIKVTSEDYQKKVSDTLKDYRKKVNMPGFRAGHVPMGLIQKQYGKSVLLEELNRVVNHSLQKYLAENKVEILGNPIPKTDGEVEGDFNKPEDFEFTYEIGLAPKFNVSVTKKDKYNYVKVKVDKTLIDKQIDDLRRRYGKLISSEEVSDNDLIMAQFVELNEDESIMEGGILHSSTISVEFVTDKKVAKALKGQKPGFKMIVDPAAVSRGGKDTAAMLGIDEAKLDTVSNKFQMTITEVKGMELAELNAELYDKLFGPGTVTDEKGLRERVKNDLDGMFVGDSDRMLTKSVYDDLLAKTKLELPDEFLKRWIKLSNEKEISEEQINEDYANYAKSLKWQLIQGNIFKTNDIKLENEEVIHYTKGLLASNYAQYGMPAPEDEELTKSAMEVLQNREEANRVYEMLAEQKLTSFFKETVKLNEKEVSYDEFKEMAEK
jgi:trigger factor